jgi:MFS family permease
MSEDNREQSPDAENSATDDDDLLNIELEDLDDEPVPPAEPAPLPPIHQPATDADTLVIELDDLDDEPAGYPPAGPAADYPAVDTGAGYDLYAKTKKNPVAAFFGNLMLQMMIAGLIGGLLAWIANEPWTHDNQSTGSIRELYLHSLLFFGIVGALIGAALGALEGLLTAAYARMAKGAGLGLLIGFVGGAVAGLGGQLLYSFITGSAASIPMRILGRTVGWALAGMAIGLAQGARYLNFKRVINGLVGGAVGGFAGGILFDPVAAVIGGEVSRLVGLAVIGAATGAAIGLLEEIRKQAWITIVEGPLTGKEFILFKQVTTIGSAPHCDIPLFKDPHIAPEHARIQQSGNVFLIASLAGPEAVFVNGRPATNQPLRSGDLLHLGATAFYYQDRALDEAVPPPHQ